MWPAPASLLGVSSVPSVVAALLALAPPVGPTALLALRSVAVDRCLPAALAGPLAGARLALARPARPAAGGVPATVLVAVAVRLPPVRAEL